MTGVQLMRSDARRYAEAAVSQGATNPLGVSIFQLKPTSITPAVESMMLAFQDDIYHFQEILKGRAQAAALLARLRVKGYQCTATPTSAKKKPSPCTEVGGEKTARALDMLSSGTKPFAIVSFRSGCLTRATAFRTPKA